MDQNYDPTKSADAARWEKVRNVALMAVLIAVSYQAGLGHGRAEKATSEYAALKSKYDKMLSEYDRAFGEYSAMKSRCDQTSAQYAALKAQYDRFGEKQRATP
jgi:hypothetical protein